MQRARLRMSLLCQVTRPGRHRTGRRRRPAFVLPGRVPPTGTNHDADAPSQILNQVALKCPWSVRLRSSWWCYGLRSSRIEEFQPICHHRLIFGSTDQPERASVRFYSWANAPLPHALQIDTTVFRIHLKRRVRRGRGGKGLGIALPSPVFSLRSLRPLRF